MKIIYVGNAQGISNFDKYYLIPQRLINGFSRLGHTVYVFNDRDVARYGNIFRSQKLGKKFMNDSLIDACLVYRPDLIVLGHCKNVSNETLEEIKKNVPEVKIIYRNVDPLSSSGNVRDICQRMASVDSIYVTTAGEALRQFSSRGAGVYFMPNPVDVALDTVCAFDNPAADIDVLFLASFLRDQHDHRHITARYLFEHLPEENVKIGGAGINQERIYGAGFYDVLARSKMGLGISKTAEFYLYCSDRVSQYMAAGIMTFLPEGPKFEDVLGADSFVSFSSNEDLVRKIRYFKNHENERIEIAKNGYRKVRDVFDVEKICQFMIDTTFGASLSMEYRWPTERY